MSAKAQFKVVVCGGAGGIGQPLSMLIAMNPLVKELCVQDVTMAMVPPAGVAADLSHLEMPSRVRGFAIDPSEPAVDQLEDCLAGADLLLVPAGLPRKPGMTRDDLFSINAGIARGIVEACATHCPGAVVGLIVNPVNSIVPAMGAYYEKLGLDPMRIVGVTTLDAVRANKFVAEEAGRCPSEVAVPVVGGHAGRTILPLFSQDPAAAGLHAGLARLDARTQDGGTEVVEAKAGKGSATLSMAYAGARFGGAVLQGLAGTPTDECAYVRSSVVQGLPYFSSRVTFGVGGIQAVHGLGALSAHEEERLAEASEQLKKEIDKGLEYAASL